MRARIIGTGSYAPIHTMRNDDLAQLVETNDEWIQDHTGIKERRISDQGTVQMASEAARKALEDSNITVAGLDMILVATVTPDYSFPNTASLVQAQLGAKDIPCIDLSAACSGFLFAMNTANAYICSGMYKTILVIGAETLSKIIDWTDRSTCILFGDGAGAVVMQAAETGIMAMEMGSDGSKGMVLYCEGRPLKNPITDQEVLTGYQYGHAAKKEEILTGYQYGHTARKEETLTGYQYGHAAKKEETDGEKLHMDGSDVFKFAVRRIPDTIHKTLELAGMTVDQVDHFVLHQANRRILEAAARRLDLPIEKFPMNIDRYGNIAAASIPILLDELNHSGKLERGQYVLTSGFGAGLSWGSALIQW